MNILPISFSQNFKTFPNSNGNAQFMPKYKNNLASDTVQFTGRNVRSATNKMTDILEKCVEDKAEVFKAEANVFKAVLKSACEDLSQFGFRFDEAYNSICPVKSPKSYVSKVVRTSSMDVPDAIRMTVFVDDPYDMSLFFDHFLPLMKDEYGYAVSRIDVPKSQLLDHGYLPKTGEDLSESIRIADFDVRLRPRSVKKYDKKLPRDFKYMYGTNQKSFYEDLQMRFVKVNDTSDNPHKHEVIVLFGKNYANAKHEESERVYSFIRKFGELYMPMDDSSPVTKSAEPYANIIKTKFRNEVSKKLFLNAKNIDYNKTPDLVDPVSFNPEDVKTFKQAIAGLKRAIKTYFANDEKSRKHDLKIISEIEKGLSDTIEHYAPEAMV